MLNKRMIRKGREEDRHLPQHTPEILTASARKLHVSYVMSRYRTYTFPVTMGKPAKIRIRNTSLKEVTLIRFWGELTRFRILREGA